ncbi:MAG: hypothetical protein WBB81_02680 [Pyrinomonadaceae bacterium]
MTHQRDGVLEPALLMANSDEIHHSIAEAGDIEEIHEEIAVADVFRNLLHHPAQIITRWNWKTALVGALVRSSFYFTVYLASRESWIVTITAVLVEMSFRFFTTGAAGAVVQSFRRATPQWLATAIISISLPTITHIIEFFTHYVQEHYFASIFPPSQNDARQKTFAVSVLFSVISAMFNMYMMRHGVLLVGAGEEQKPILQDFKKMPVLVKDFTIYLPALILRLISESRIFSAFGLFAFFGLAVGGILGTTRGVWNWAYRSAFGAWGLLLFSIIVGAIVMHFRKKRRLARGEAS